MALKVQAVGVQGHLVVVQVLAWHLAVQVLAWLAEAEVLVAFVAVLEVPGLEPVLGAPHHGDLEGLQELDLLQEAAFVLEVFWHP